MTREASKIRELLGEMFNNSVFILNSIPMIRGGKNKWIGSFSMFYGVISIFIGLATVFFYNKMFFSSIPKLFVVIFCYALLGGEALVLYSLITFIVRALELACWLHSPSTFTKF